MKTLLRPRLWISLLLGIAAALLVGMLPPLPDWTATLPEDSVLREVSSDGRYLVSSTVWEAEPAAEGVGVIHVWDRAAGMEKPMISVPIPRRSDFAASLLSPDERMLACCVYHPHDQRHYLLHVFDLVSGKELHACDRPVEHLFFSPAGKLHYVNNSVVRELDTDREVRAVPSIAEFTPFMIGGHQGEYAIYYTGVEEAGSSTDGEVRIFSLLTGQMQERMALPGREMNPEALSRNGRTLYARGREPGQDPSSRNDFQVLVDTSTNQVRTWHERFAHIRVTSPDGAYETPSAPTLSPDGIYFASLAPTQRPDWLAEWWPVEGADNTLHIKLWTTGTEIAQFRQIEHVVFSPQTTLLALQRRDGVGVAGGWPVRPPWGLIAGAALVTALGAWSVGWLWSRWRSRKIKGGIA